MHMCCSVCRMLQSIHVDSTSRSVRGGDTCTRRDGHRCCRRRSRLRRLPIPAIPRPRPLPRPTRRRRCPVHFSRVGASIGLSRPHTTEPRARDARLTAGRDKGSVSALLGTEARRTRGWGSLRGAPRAPEPRTSQPRHEAPAPRCAWARRDPRQVLVGEEADACRRHGRRRSRRRRP